jgi:type I restriction enzyme, S subunit
VSGFAVAPMRTLLALDYKAKRPTNNAKVWCLNLDQIEPHSGKLFTKQLVNASEVGPSTYAFEKGTVLYSKLRPYLNKVLVADAEGMATTELVPLRCDQSRIFPDFLAHFLRSQTFLAFATNVVAGAKMPRMVMGEFWAYPVPLPKLEEQRRISAILDQAETLRTQRRAALAQLDSLTQSIFLDMFGDPATNSMDWSKKKLEEIADQVTDGEHLTPKREIAGIKLLSARNVRDGHIDLRDVDFIGHDEHERIKKRCNPIRGDVLISCSGSIGRVAPVETDEPFSLVRSVALIRPKHHIVYSKFLECYLRTSTMKAYMIRRANASSQANLFQGPIREMPVMLPPFALQQVFTTRIQAIEVLKATHRAALSELDALFASLQQRAFAGEL